MTSAQIPLHEALAFLPTRAWATVTALQQQGVEVTCWREDGRWILQGHLEGRTARTRPAQVLTGRSLDDLWQRMKPALEERHLFLHKRQHWGY
ncbi:hypothetical protein [Deinococcus sp. QL22]|uniref:hypothetical protein n=1 Tax=Deinococcus sp. QL22 TaxID=2939437 RepID=UPI002017191B|nr:hypothetical protein [Deinococcus sp. QL22]UQN04849.1 hypothetical protein M1R55_07905 [Deinococcus sp. QL22]